MLLACVKVSQQEAVMTIGCTPINHVYEQCLLSQDIAHSVNITACVVSEQTKVFNFCTLRSTEEQSGNSGDCTHDEI